MVEKKKMGRPTSDPKTSRFELRLSASDMAMLEECSEKLGCSKAAVILRAIREIHSKL